MMTWRVLACACLAWGAWGQTVDIYSEFSRVNPYGEVVKADRGIHRREILSPAIVRGGYATFHIVVSVPPNESYLLYIGTNPVDACRVDLYKEHFMKTPSGWIPDALTPVKQLPDFGAMPDPDDGVPGQNTRVYLMDVWVPADAPVRRFRVEAQVKAAYWIVRPMEMRTMKARIPEMAQGGMGPIPGVEAGTDVVAMGAVGRYQSGERKWETGAPMTVRGAIRRNAIQDMALAGAMDPAPALGPRVMELITGELQLFPRVLGAEWYLRLRDFLWGRE